MAVSATATSPHHATKWSGLKACSRLNRGVQPGLILRFGNRRTNIAQQ
jgi:hypothetical protein